MKETTITVTEAARNFADCVNGVPVPRLVPAGEKLCTGRELAKVLAGVPLSREDAKAWGRDLRQGRKSLKPRMAGGS